jgi:hypothetical protein
VLTDLVMPHLTGMEVLERIMEFDPSIDVILMTAHYSTESAVEAIKKGATDYLNKPISIAALRERVGKLVEEARRRQHALRSSKTSCWPARNSRELSGRSPLMWEMFSQIRRVAPHYRTVLITATGTGKDLVAQALHRLSPGGAGRYVVLNCSAVVETLFESELFGHVKGAFTGATNDKAGCSSTPTAARCSWTRSATCRWPRRPSCCAFAEPGSAARGIADAAQGGRARDRGHQSRSARRGSREALSRGSVLPAVDGGDEVPRLAERKRICRCWSAISSPGSRLNTRRKSAG